MIMAIATRPASPTTPPRFDRMHWGYEQPPTHGYVRPRFDFGLVASLLRLGEDQVYILDFAVPAVNIQQGMPAEDPSYPLYFECTGRIWHYVVSVWADRLQIEVCEKTGYKVRSTMFPVTPDELRRAFQTLVDDCA